MKEVQLRKVSKRYNPGLFKKKVQAVKDLDLDVNAGEVYGLIGPNGAGKSTTIRMILGMTRPDHGEILFRGQGLDKADFRRDIGYLPENPYLYDHLSLKELLAFCGRLSGLNPSVVRRRSAELIEQLALGGADRRPLRTYSKGMLQRAGICFALLHNPSIIILDEPMSGLDPVGRKMVFDLVSDLRRQGKTIFFCSHILSDVEKLCDRIGLLVGGRMVQTFKKEEILSPKGNLVHLIVSPFDGQLRDLLEPFVEEVRREHKGEVLSVNPDHLSRVYELLDSKNCKILGIRSEQISLEELFIKAVEEVRL